MEERPQSSDPGPDDRRLRWGTYAAIGILGYFLFTEHQAHVIQFLPYLLLMACPLIHVFMHGGHGHHHRHGSGNDGAADKKEDRHE